MVTRSLAGLAAALVVAVAGCGGKPTAPPPKPPEQPKQAQPPALPPPAQPGPMAAGAKPRWDQPPEIKIDPNKQYTATLKTSKGEFKVELFAKDAPKAVNNFVFLARERFYDGVRFHRIMKTFMVQTGDPQGNGTGGPGYRFEDELPPKRPYEPGMVAMANSGKNTNGSQFFICTGADCKNLDNFPNYTQFGRVVSGMDVVEKIAATPVGPGPRGEQSVPKEEVTIQSVTIEEK